jgi:putative MATE family efflux protein
MACANLTLLMNTKNHTEALGTEPIGKLLARIAIPSSIALFVTSTYNLVDAIFVGRGVGPDALGALTLVHPFQIAVMAAAALISVGSSSVVSRALGAEDYPRAGKALGNAFTLAMAAGVLLTVLGEIFLDGTVRILGASDDLSAPTRDYLSVILFVEPLILFNFTANALMRAEGQAKMAMVTMIAGMLINIALDPLFIFVCGWGVKGAALATLVGRGTTSVMILFFYAKNGSSLELRLSYFRPNLKMLREIFSIGISAFFRQAGSGLVAGIRNNLLVAYGGSMFISAFGAVFRLIMFLGMPGMGIAQALQPIAGYNYGAGKISRVRRSLWVSIGACTLFMCIGFGITQLFPGELLRLFSSDDSLSAEGIPIMRYSAFLFIVFPAYMLAPSFYQAIGKPGRAFFLSLTRPISGIVLMLICVRAFGVMGVVAADPIAVTIGAVAAILYLRSSLKKLTL